MAQNDEGAVHLIEAAIAAAIVMAVLYYLSSVAPMQAEPQGSGLEDISSDILSILEFRANSLDHPSLGFALSTMARWNDSSSRIYADAVRTLPAGTYCYIETPYGSIGQRPAGECTVYVKPFIASGDGGAMLDCELVLWRA